MAWEAAVLTVLVGAVLIAVALQWRNPALVGRGPLPQALFVALDVTVLWLAALLGWRSPALAILSATPAFAAGLIAFAAAYQAAALRRQVLALPADRLRPAAAHVIAGFYDFDEARTLAAAGVGGLFLSPRNARGLTVEALAREIAALQALRADRHLPRLWIAADQEGGLVATLSPPLPRPAAPPTLAADPKTIEQAARAVGEQLASIGVTVNFAPVVDVTRGQLDASDRNSRIARRSFSGDPAVVTRDAAAYCRGLAAAGIVCTLKHFPGLGAIAADTHVTAAHEPTIEPIDLEPFRRLVAVAGPHPWVMLGHLAVDDRDPSRPASASPTLIEMLRTPLGHNGVIVTDDAAMTPYRGDLATHVESTMASGADFVLASWNPDVAFQVIADLAARLPEDAGLARSAAASDARLAIALREQNLPRR